MKVQNTLVAKPEKKPFSAVISGEGAQKLIRASLRDDGSVKRFTGTLISVVNASKQLQNCDPGSIISAALRGEGAGLIYGQGYYVVPYGSVATYLTSYKGWIQLAIATGMYADIDCLDVREGERKGRDPRTGKPIIDMSVYDTDEEREQHPIIGVKAYFILRDGMYREEYWTMGEILRHANRYSQAFDINLYEKWQAGEQLTKDEAYTVNNGSPWYTNTIRMAKKTVLKSLLTSGFAPLSNEVKSMLNAEPESGEAVLPDFGDAAMPDYSVVETTGEVISNEDAQGGENSAPDGETPNMEQPDEASDEKPKRGRKSRMSEVSDGDGIPEAEEIKDFFGN